MPQRTSDRAPVKSVDTTLRIIEFIRDRDGARAGEVARELDLPDSTVSDHLVTLRQNRYLVKHGNQYRVGLRFLEFGDRARNYRKVYRVGKRNVDKLAAETGELAHLSVEEDGLGTIIYEREGADAIALDTYVGRRVKMHCTALGKAMLAHMADDYVNEIVDRYGLSAETEHTITDRETLNDDLKQIRKQGYAVSSGERISSLGCIAVPVTETQDGKIFGALSLCAPLSRTNSDGFSEEILQKVQQTANRIELDTAFD